MPRAETLVVLASLPRPKPDLMVNNVEACHALSGVQGPIEGLHHSWRIVIKKGGKQIIYANLKL